MNVAEYKAWFNAKAILTPAEKMVRTLYKECGAYTRTVAKNSMKQPTQTEASKAARRAAMQRDASGKFLKGSGKVSHSLPAKILGYSQPGAAAFSRLGWIKQFIYFAADKDSVVIGPALLTGVKSKGAVEHLEHGGIEQLNITKWIKGQKTQTSVTAMYKARPTMGLAFAKMIDKKLPKLIENGIMREA